jgi:hypothetical protein
VVATIYPWSDSYVNENAPTNNYGADADVRVRSTTAGTPDTNYRSFAQFDTSSISTGAKVVSATLRLYMYQAPNTSRSYEAHGVTASWTETGIAWGNQPAVAASASATSATGTTSNVWVEWNVTSDVQSFANLTLTNSGWRIKDQTESSGTDYEARFYSRNNPGVANDPQLVVTYNP